MWDFRKTIAVFCVGLFLASCQSGGNDVSGLDSVLTPSNAGYGVIVFATTLSNGHCESKVSVSGTTTDGRPYSELIWSGIGATLSPRKYMLAKLPAGDYSIDGINCPGSYTLGATGGKKAISKLARFSVKPGQVNNLSVLAITKAGTTGISGNTTRFRIKRTVRPFKKSELFAFTKKYPKLAAQMVDDPMDVSLSEEDLERAKKLLDEILKNAKKKKEATPAS